MAKKKKHILNDLDRIHAIGTDLKLSIEDLIYEIAENKKDILEIKEELGLTEPEDEDDEDILSP
jgi:hypothetical protein